MDSTANTDGNRDRQDLLDHLPGTVFQADASGRLTFVSQPAFQLFGVPPGEAFPATLVELLDPGEQPRAQAVLERILAGEELPPQEYRAHRRDGAPLSVLVQASRVLQAGTAVGLQGILLDLGTAGSAPAPLRQGEQGFRSLFALAPLGILLFDEHGNVLDGNQRLAAVLGVPHAALTANARVEDLLGALGRAALLHALETGEGSFEGACVPRASGRKVVVRVTFRAVREANGRFLAGIGMAEDVHARHQAERALAEREEQLRTLLGAMPDIVCFKDGHGRWLEANPFDLELFQLTGVDYQGKTDRELAAYSGFYREAFLACEESDEQAWRGGTVHRAVEVIPVPDGPPKSFDIIKVPLFHPDGSRRGLVVIGRDITEQKRLEQQFLQSQKMEAVGRLAGGVAHDFNNLLTAISGFTSLALETCAPGPPQEYLREVLATAERASALTRQLLAFSRRQVIQPRVVSLNSQVEHMRALLHRLLGEAVDLRLEPLAAPDLVRVDPSQLEQVIMNLALNARDAMPAGGRLLLRTTRVNLEGTGEGAAHGEHVELEVTDTGTGMDAAVRARLFEPFFTTKPKGEGTGLGLATCYGIVQQAGGHLVVESEPGRGTTFRVRLPRCQGEEGPELPVDPAAATPGTVLLVEDEDALRELATKVLAREGWQVLPAATCQEALALAHTHAGHLQVLFTDLVLPDGSGQELAATLKARVPGLRVLYTSGHVSHAGVRDTQREHAGDFLPKPYTPTMLVARLRAG